MRKKIIYALAALLLVLVIKHKVISSLATTTTHLAANTVMVLGNHRGGTGVILNSSVVNSSVLTNKHVCDAIKHVGHVVDDAGTSFSIINFKQSELYDLCQIWVVGDLRGQTTLALSAPEPYDEAIVAGHPHLIPTVVLRGRFGQRIVVNVNGEDGPLEAQFISMVIAPGSSGSAVYNSYGELSGMVFAGSGDLFFGLIVPYEYLKYFLTVELPLLRVQVITPEPTPIFSFPTTAGQRCGTDVACLIEKV